MANPMRILFVSDEVAPFTEASTIAELVRQLPEQLQESGDYEVRIMMPRYGTISERRNRLHEVIRLSGTDVTMGEDTETLKVKVASIPGIRLQVYFMDNATYFKRKGLYADKNGKVFEDNAARALFFGRSALATIRNLGWSPNVVHAFGWMSGFVPMLLKEEFAEEALYAHSRAIYTPNPVDFSLPLTEPVLTKLGLSADERLTGRELSEAGAAYADAVILPPGSEEVDGTARFSEDPDALLQEARALYDEVLNEVPA